MDATYPYATNNQRGARYDFGCPSWFFMAISETSRPMRVENSRCRMTFNITGEGPKWGTYSIFRNVTVAVVNKEIKLAVSGEASFSQGVFAKDSPVMTDVDLTYMMDDSNLVGKFSKVIKGIEYPIPLYDGNYPFKNLKMMAILMNIVNFYP